jgi:hypothetical protein
MSFEALSAAARAKKLDEAEKKALGITPKVVKVKDRPKAKAPKVKVDPKHKKTREEAIAAQQAADRAAIKKKREAKGEKEEFWVQ